MKSSDSTSAKPKSEETDDDETDEEYDDERADVVETDVDTDDEIDEAIIGVNPSKPFEEIETQTEDFSSFDNKYSESFETMKSDSDHDSGSDSGSDSDFLNTSDNAGTLRHDALDVIAA
jgi:hypothetical protein